MRATSYLSYFRVGDFAASTVLWRDTKSTRELGPGRQENDEDKDHASENRGLDEGKREDISG